MLSGCMSSEERQKASQLERNFSKAFKASVKETYGKSAKLSSIKADTDISGGTVWPSFKLKINGVLNGTVKLDGESFKAKYGTVNGTLSVQRNNEKIKQSIYEMFEPLGLDIVDLEIVNSSYDIYYLPEEVDTFEKMLETERHFTIQMFVRRDLSELRWEDFESIRDGYSKGKIKIYQLENYPSGGIERKMFNRLRPIDFSTDAPRYYSTADKEYVDAIDFFGIETVVTIKDRKMYFQDKNSKEA
ncbi:hypothetical protein LJC01_02560, partial [Clostridiaceae bacterium OttesenSCG-928-D20]|nr:hypothetical protein [Clostridiaceae bacterium OttesenSCG-928-D20]